MGLDRIKLGFVALLAMGVCASADVVPGAEHATSSPAYVAPSDGDGAPFVLADVRLEGAVRYDWVEHHSVERAVPADPGAYVIELPASPGSAGLFLSGALSVGAWHLVRAGRRLQFGNQPQWYHTDCPEQIGHAVPFDLQLALQPLCEILQPRADRPFYLGHGLEEHRPRSVQFFSIVTSRGPPCAV